LAGVGARDGKSFSISKVADVFFAIFGCHFAGAKGRFSFGVSLTFTDSSACLVKTD